MSLTTFLQCRDVRERFRQEFPKPRLTIKLPLLAVPLTKNYSSIGSAFDYLLRFHVERFNNGSVIRSWVAKSALSMIIGEAEGRDDYELLKKAEHLFANAERNYRLFLNTGNLSDDLIISTIALAHFDAVFRGKERVYDSVFHWIKSGAVSDEDIQDLKNIVALIQPEMFEAHDTCLLNPTFNHASQFLNGADADLIIDGCIIDIKTTKNLRFEQEYFHQVLGYYMLYRIGGITGIKDEHEITSIAIYFSRYGYLLKLNIRDVINEEKVPEFLDWFVDRAEKEFGVLEAMSKYSTRHSLDSWPLILRDYSARNSSYS